MMLRHYLPLLHDQRLIRTTLRLQQRPGEALSRRDYACGQTEAAVRRVHPLSLPVRVVADRRETSSTRTLVLDAVDGALPPYLPGQYVNVFTTIAGLRTSRPMSISSSPGRSAFLEITVRAKPSGLVSRHLVERVRVGDTLTISGPTGDFFHNPVRDSDELVFLAGGSGVTPFMGMAAHVLDRRPRARVLLLYGSRSEEDIIFEGRLAELARSTARLRVVHVISSPGPGWTGEVGLLDGALLRRQLAAWQAVRPTFFICGPAAMSELVVGALRELGVSPSAIRTESASPPDDITRVRGWPAGLSPDAVFTVRLRGSEEVLEARAGEPLMAALERAGRSLPALCRSGVCGSCRTRLLGGRVFTAPGVVLRPGDLAGGFIHACASFPLGDLVLDGSPTHDGG